MSVMWFVVWALGQLRPPRLKFSPFPPLVGIEVSDLPGVMPTIATDGKYHHSNVLQLKNRVNIIMVLQKTVFMQKPPYPIFVRACYPTQMELLHPGSPDGRQRYDGPQNVGLESCVKSQDSGCRDRDIPLRFDAYLCISHNCDAFSANTSP
ncbi:hypothetical protein ACLOJK_000900 [Asimina triloba]